MQASQDLEYGYVSSVDVPFEEAVDRLEAGLKSEGLWSRLAGSFSSLRRDSTLQELAIQVGTPNRGSTQRCRMKYAANSPSIQ